MSSSRVQPSSVIGFSSIFNVFNSSSLCLEEYSEQPLRCPRMLLCGHTFCTGCRSSTALVSSRRKHRAALLVMPSVADLSGERSRRARPPSARWTCSCARLLAHTTLHVVLAAAQACSTTFYSIWSLERAERGAVAMACGLHWLGRHEAAVWGLMRASVRSSPMQFTKYGKVK